MDLRALLLPLAFLFFLPACEKEKSGPAPDEAGPYFPLAVGNQWEYDYKIQSSVGQEVEEILTLSVIGTVEIEGADWYELDGPDKLLALFPQFLRADDGRLLLPGNEVYLTLEDPNTVFRKDTVYVDNDPNQPVAVIEHTLDTQEQSVSVPAGDFSCVEVSTTLTSINPGFSGPDSEVRVYFAKDVGVVQRKVDYLHTGGKIEIFLRAYQLN